MLRNVRQAKILELIARTEIETQEELCAALADCGFTVTQATISRDVKELHLFKVKGERKRFRYAAAQEAVSGETEKARTLFRACVEHIRCVNNLVVVKTLTGSGANAGVVIDGLGYREVVGSIAGDDTVLLICDTSEGGKLVADRLTAIVRG